MSIQFFYLSGSPFAWKVWLALEHKQIPYELKVMSVDGGELKTPDYRATNPRGKAPAIVHDGFALYESAAIVEYLEDAFPHDGEPLWPDEVNLRAQGRRTAAEADAYLYPPVRRLVEQLLMRKPGETDESVVSDARQAVTETLNLFGQGILGPYALGIRPSAADYAVYPLTALLRRIDTRRPECGVAASIPASVSEWQGRIESLPFFDKTWPPHWGPRRLLSANTSP